MCFKYINVVEDGTENITSKVKEVYKVTNDNHQNSGFSCIIPLHGKSPELAAQYYLFENPTVPFVYCETATPESNYTQLLITKHFKNPSLQKKLVEEYTLIHSS